MNRSWLIAWETKDGKTVYGTIGALNAEQATALVTAAMHGDVYTKKMEEIVKDRFVFTVRHIAFPSLMLKRPV